MKEDRIVVRESDHKVFVDMRYTRARYKEKFQSITKSSLSFSHFTLNAMGAASLISLPL